MANVYCGFLLLPLLFFSFTKVGLDSGFSIHFMIFTVVCLAAAAGKYFFVRSLLYKFYPGMNMIRHTTGCLSSICCLGPHFISAEGFDWMLQFCCRC